MAHYRKIDTRILLDKTFNELTSDARLVFFHLLVHLNLTSLGAMRVSIPGLADELNWEVAQLEEALLELAQKEMVRYDKSARFVWLPNFLKYNTPESPNVIKSWETALGYLPECALRDRLIVHVREFIAGLSDSFQEALPVCFQQNHLASESLVEGIAVSSERLFQETAMPSGRVVEEVTLPSESLVQEIVMSSERLFQKTAMPFERLLEGVGENSFPLSEPLSIKHKALSIEHKTLNIEQESKRNSVVKKNIVTSAEQKITKPSDAEISEVFHDVRQPLEHSLQKPSPVCFQQNHLASESLVEEITMPSERLFQETSMPFERLPEGVEENELILPKPLSIKHRTLNIEHKALNIKQESKSNSEVEKKIVTPAGQKNTKLSDAKISEVFHCWKQTLGHPQAVLDVKRKKRIRQALGSGYSVAQLCEAVRGCSYTPHNMGDNEQGQRYDSVHVIFRDADQIDRFIRNARSPPRPKNAADKLLTTNVAAGQRWLQKKLQEQKEKTIDENV